METTPPLYKILMFLLKAFTIKPTITALSKEIGLSRVGTWKLLKRMEAENLVSLSPVGEGKTSTITIGLKWENPLLEKILALAMAEEAISLQRWRTNFGELEAKTDFILIYGSILSSPKEANDIDLLGVTQNFREVEGVINKAQKTQIKNIHAINFTPSEFKVELEKPNKAFLDAILRGVILFGQEKFVQFIKGISRK
jgi:DNA-binding Lrp family transcriptional regulator